ncbi:MAG: flagellar motor protein MotB [Actinomycetota bacterium]
MSGGGGESRGRNRHHEEEHEEHVNHEAWVIPYADVLTLLMALFLVMWALGDPNPDKTNVAAESFRRELGGRGGISNFDIGFGTGGGPLANGGVSVLEGGGAAPMPNDDGDPNSRDGGATNPVDPPGGPDDDGILAGMPTSEIGPTDPRFDPLDAPGDDEGDGQDEPDFAGGDAVIGPLGPIDPNDGAGGFVTGDGSSGDAADPPDPLDEIEEAVREEAIGSGLSTAVGFRREARGLVVSIVADQVLFGAGDDSVQPDGILILDVIADALRETPNAIIVEGHTDNRPISTAEFPSNWELSTARATSVVRFLSEQAGLERGRLSAAGFADTRPISEGNDPASLARNRRVEIVVIG